MKSIKTIKRTKKKNNRKIYLKGGKMLGKGSFGCVITPPIGCYNMNIDKFKNRKYVSKIVHSDGYDNEITNEVKMGHFVYSLDKVGKYFTPIIKYCYIKDETRDNIMQIESINNSNDYYVIRNDYPGIKDSKKCKIDEKRQPYNLILRNAGGDLAAALEKPKFSLEHKYLIKNIRSVMKHLCMAVKKLHDNHVLQRDIKPENISFKIDITGQVAKITIFDFGISEFLTNNTLNNIASGGTMVFKPPEIGIIKNIVKELNKSNKLSTSIDRLRDKKIILKIFQKSRAKYEKYDKTYNAYRKLQRGGITNIDMFKKTVKTNTSDFYKPSIDDILIYKNVLNLIQEGILETEFYKQHGILCKWDVYSLGMSFLEMITDLKYYNKDCIDLINNMINIDFTKRYNILDCLKHRFLQVKKTKKVKRRNRSQKKKKNKKIKRRK